MTNRPLILLATVATLSLSVFIGSSQTNTPSIIVVRPDNETLQLLRESSKKNWPEWIRNFSLTVLGGFIGAWAGYLASRRMHKFEIQERANDENKFEDNVLRAILYELDALGKIYDEGIGQQQKDLDKSEILQTRLSLTQDWFTIFHCNAVHLGKIDGKISRQIIVTYAQIKRLIEDFRINNDYIARLDEIESQLQLAPYYGNYLLAQKSVYHTWMVAQKKRIMEGHIRCKEAVEELKSLLAKRGIN